MRTFLLTVILLCAGTGCSHQPLPNESDDPLAEAPPTAGLLSEGVSDEATPAHQSAPARDAEDPEVKQQEGSAPITDMVRTGGVAMTDTEAWEEYGFEDGIRVWRKEVEGSPIVAFRGEAIVEASIPKIAAVLADAQRRGEWIADAKEAKDIRQFSPIDRIEYNRTGTPWPLLDRDFVYRTTVEADRVKRVLRVFIRSVEDERMPARSGIVRGELMHSSYLLTEAGDGTRVRVEIHADPKGAVPKWAVNLVQKGWPKATLEGLRRQVAKPDVFEDATLRAYFDQGLKPDWATQSAQKK